MQKATFEKMSSCKPPRLAGAVMGVLIMLFAGFAHAATQVEICTQVAESCTKGAALEQVIGQAIDAALAGGVALDELAPALAETIMKTCAAEGQDGVAQAGDIAGTMLRQLMARGMDNAVILRTVSQMILGIRAAAAAKGLDDTMIHSRVQDEMCKVAGSDEVCGQLTRVADSAFSEAYAETYTAPAAAPVAAPAPPAAPPGTPSQVANAYDPTASATR